MPTLLDNQQIIERILNLIDNKTTDLGEIVGREPVSIYISGSRGPVLQG